MVLVFGGETYSSESSVLREHPLGRCDGSIPDTDKQYKHREVALLGTLLLACGGCYNGDPKGCNGLSRAVVLKVQPFLLPF